MGYVESRIETIRGQLSASRPKAPEMPVEEVKSFVLACAQELQTLLLGDRMAAKQVLRSHMNPMVLTPTETEEGPVFKVEGELDLFSGLSSGMLLAAPQGFEPR